MTRFLEDILGLLAFDGIPIALGCGWMLLAFVGMAMFFAKRRKAAAWVGGIALLWVTVLLTADFVLLNESHQVRNNFHLVKPGMDEAQVLALLGKPDMHSNGPAAFSLFGKAPNYNRHVYIPSRAFGHPKAEFPFWAVQMSEWRIFGPLSTDYVVKFDPGTMTVVSTSPGGP